MKYAGESNLPEIGDRNVIREFVTINRGTVQGASTTCIKQRQPLMAYVHIAYRLYIVGVTPSWPTAPSLGGMSALTLRDFRWIHHRTSFATLACAFCAMEPGRLGCATYF